MTAPALVALAHGSRDPRSARTVRALVDEVRRMRPDLRIEPAFLDLAKPTFGTVVDRLVRAGYDEILDVLDRRLREALCEARVCELDALVLAAAGTTDPLATQSINRLARLWGNRHKLPVVTAFASASPPATGEAVRAFRGQGRRHIAVGSLFLAPGFLYDRASELALEAGAVAVSQPFGADPEVARTILARYAVGAVELVPV